MGNPKTPSWYGTDEIPSIKAVTDNLPNAGALTDITDVTGALPDAGALTSISDETDKIQSIKTVTDNLPNSGALTAISNETDKIDGAAIDGLGGTVDSLAYMAELLRRHHHNRERWWGATGAPTETNAIAVTVTVPFAATSGADTWGAAIPICGTADDPTPGDGDTKFDLHRLLIVGLDDQVDAWRVRIIWGTGTSGDAITAGNWTEIMVQSNVSPGNRAGAQPVDVIMLRVDVGTKCWAQSYNDTNGEILQFYIGVHGYVA